MTQSRSPKPPTGRGTSRSAPGPRRRAPQAHDRVVGRARRGRPQPRRSQGISVQRPDRSAEPRPILRTLTKGVARVVLGLVILAVFVFGVFPTGSYVEQRNELDRAVDELGQLEGDNDLLQRRVVRLESDEEIERVARQEFDMVLPDEESYLILPPGS